MLSNEEKQAIEYLKRHIIPCYGRKGTIEFMLNDTLINLIEKQSKEIEELKEEKENLLDALNNSIDIKKYWVNKDKIKAKIEELNKDLKEYENGQEWEIQDEIRGQIDILQSLLEKE